MKARYYLFFMHLVLLLPSERALASIYQEKNNGGVVFTDQPTSSNAELLITTPTSVVESVSAQPSASANQSQPAPVVKNVAYTAFNLIAPTNGQTIQNQPQLTATFDVKPALQPGDSIQLYLDGQAWGPAQASPQITMTSPNRGTHSFAAKLIDSKQTILREVGPVTIYVHQQSALNPNNPINRPQTPYGVKINTRAVTNVTP